MSHEKYSDMVADLFDNFKIIGGAVHTPRLATEWEEKYQKEKAKLYRTFPGGKHRGEHVDKESIIYQYHAIYLESCFPFGVPENFMTGPKIIAIMKARNMKK